MDSDWFPLLVALCPALIAFWAMLSAFRDALLIYDAESRGVLDPLATIPGRRRFAATVAVFMMVAVASAGATWSLWRAGQLGSALYGLAAATVVFALCLAGSFLYISISSEARGDLKPNAVQRWLAGATTPQTRLALRLAGAGWKAYAILLLLLGYLYGIKAG